MAAEAKVLGTLACASAPGARQANHVTLELFAELSSCAMTLLLHHDGAYLNVRDSGVRTHTATSEGSNVRPAGIKFDQKLRPLHKSRGHGFSVSDNFKADAEAAAARIDCCKTPFEVNSL